MLLLLSQLRTWREQLSGIMCSYLHVALRNRITLQTERQAINALRTRDNHIPALIEGQPNER